MDNTTKQLPDRVAFLSDVHLGMPGDNPARAHILAQFIATLQNEVSHLYIVGDLFDFWFEYRRVVPNIAPSVIFELYNLVQAGTEVTIFAGNHDYWIGPYLENEVGLHVITDGLDVTHQSRHLYIHHGDGLYPDDHGYRILKRVLRHPLSIRLFSFLHPDLAGKIAALTSKSSRQYFAPPKHDDHHIKLFQEIADNRFSDECDAAIYGHTHVPLIDRRENGTLVLLGDWIRHFTYVILENGEFTLNTWKKATEAVNG